MPHDANTMIPNATGGKDTVEEAYDSEMGSYDKDLSGGRIKPGEDKPAVSTVKPHSLKSTPTSPANR